MFTTPPPGKHFFSSPYQAAMLLAVLVAHLAYMATPIHTRTLTDESHTVAMAAPVDDATTAVIDGWDAQSRHPSDCGIQWTKASNGASLAGFVVFTLPGSLLGFDEHTPMTSPTARALGPPSIGDQQALLQVFRL
jgi:hypothetical protein